MAVILHPTSPASAESILRCVAHRQKHDGHGVREELSCDHRPAPFRRRPWAGHCLVAGSWDDRMMWKRCHGRRCNRWCLDRSMGFSNRSRLAHAGLRPWIRRRIVRGRPCISEMKNRTYYLFSQSSSKNESRHLWTIPPCQGGLQSFFVNKLAHSSVSQAHPSFLAEFYDRRNIQMVIWLKCFFAVRNAFCISLKVIQSLGHILFETALACGHGQLLFEPGRLRPHPSLRDHGLRYSTGRPTSLCRHWWFLPIVLKISRDQIIVTPNKTGVSQANDTNDPHRISRNRQNDDSTNKRFNFLWKLLSFLILHWFVTYIELSGEAEAGSAEVQPVEE